MKSEYVEKLQTGGDLIVSLADWKIQYYFPGIDFRYNGTFITIHSRNINEYIYAWKENFHTYTSLLGKITDKKTLTLTGLKDMPIRIGEFNGVYLTSYNLRIRTKNVLNRLISDYEYAKRRASQIQVFLKTL